jgi:hypothetical protein
VGEREGVCFSKGGDASVGCVCEGSEGWRQTGEDERAEILRVCQYVGGVWNGMSYFDELP